MTTTLTGAFGRTAVRMRDFLDGQSNTIAFSERAYGTVKQQINPTDPSPFSGAGTFLAARGLGTEHTASGPASADLKFGEADVLFSAWGRINYNSVTDGYRRFEGISSRHPTGVNVANADGSVRFLNEAIDQNVSIPFQTVAAQPSVFRQLISRRDGTVIPQFD
ncbi:MAG: DUF1559 domain-containing protein [Pirellulaceae bacterium]